MKKVFFSIAIVVVIASMVSCGNKTAKGGDSDSTAVADSAVTAASEEFFIQSRDIKKPGKHIIAFISNFRFAVFRSLCACLVSDHAHPVG